MQKKKKKKVIFVFVWKFYSSLKNKQISHFSKAAQYLLTLGTLTMIFRFIRN